MTATEAATRGGAEATANERPARSRVGLILVAVVATAVVAAAWWMVSPMRAAGFGVIDDHEIVDMLDGRDRLPITEYPGELADRSNEPVGRFRPVYWAGRVAETMLHGDRPSRWYLDRIVLGALAGVALIVTLRRKLPPLLALLPGVALMAGPHSEAWTRLGPSEAYSVPLMVAGTGLLLRHVAAAWSKERRDRWFLVGLALLVAAALAKENFLLLTGPMIFVSLFVRRLWDGRERLVGFTALAVSGANAVGIAWQIGRHGDVYRQTRSLDGAGQKFAEIVQTLDNVYEWRLVVGITVVGLVCSRDPRSAIRFLAVVAAGLLFVVLPQAWFYSADVLASRYYYPASFFVPLIVGSALFSLWARRRSGPATLAVVLVTGVFGWNLWQEVRAVRLGAQATAPFIADFGASVAEATSHGRDADAIVVTTDNPPRYYEALLSTNAFVRTRFDRDHRPPIMLRLPDGLALPEHPLGRKLVIELKKISAEGGKGFVPFSSRPNCVALIVGASATPPCNRMMTMRGIP